MQAASLIEKDKREASLNDEALWGTSITTLVKSLLRIEGIPAPGGLTENLESIFHLDIPRSFVDRLCEDEESIRALDALGIARHDHRYLSEIFDPDNGGTILVSELIDGLRRLRGEPRRSDIITLDLILRSMQGSLYDVFELTMATAEAVGADTSKLRQPPRFSGLRRALRKTYKPND